MCFATFLFCLTSRVRVRVERPQTPLDLLGIQGGYQFPEFAEFAEFALSQFRNVQAREDMV